MGGDRRGARSQPSIGLGVLHATREYGASANVENSDLSEDEAMDIAVEEVRTVRRSRRG